MIHPTSSSRVCRGRGGEHERERMRCSRCVCSPADTVVVKDEEILEKPVDALDNMRMLADLNDGKVSRPVCERGGR